MKQKELDDVKKQFDIYKAKMESLLISQLELIKDINKEDIEFVEKSLRPIERIFGGEVFFKS